MARSNQWDTHEISHSHVAVHTPLESDILRKTEGGVYEGKAWLIRMTGIATVFIDNYVAGSNLTLWHGAWLGDTSQGAPHILQPSGIDEEANQGSWLWREPINLIPTATSEPLGDFAVQARFDWMIRGGKGSELRVGQKFVYVSEAASNSFPTGIALRTWYLALFAGS